MPSPQLQELIELLQKAKNQPNVTPQEARERLDKLGASLGTAAGTTVEPVDCDGVYGEWLTVPGGSPTRTLLHLHGGAYVRGSTVSHRGLVSRLAAASGTRALVVDYRLAPEHPFPAALQDAQTVYDWLLRQRVAPESLVLSGDSAGAGLALALTSTLRDAGKPLPAALALMSPWSDLALTGESLVSKREVDPWIDMALLEMASAAYLNGSDGHNPLASPVFADYRGFPPLYIIVGGRELIMDDSVRVAEYAHAAGVDVVLDIWYGMIHVFPLFAPMLPEAEAAIERIGLFIRRILGT